MTKCRMCHQGCRGRGGGRGRRKGEEEEGRRRRCVNCYGQVRQSNPIPAEEVQAGLGVDRIDGEGVVERDGADAAPAEQRARGRGAEKGLDLAGLVGERVVKRVAVPDPDGAVRRPEDGKIGRSFGKSAQRHAASACSRENVPHVDLRML